MGKDRAESEIEGGNDQVHDSSVHEAAQQVEVAEVVVELASDSEMVGQPEPEYVKVVEIEPEVVGVEAAVIGVGPVAGAEVEAGPGAVIVTEVGVDYKPAGTVEPWTADRDSNVDTAVGMDLAQGIAGSIVDIVAADTTALPLAAQQFELKLVFGA